ncbi:hypothetical protein EFBL_3589 [Effusibacillus lacus]|uniref:Glycosyl transferase family 4 n=2 Tax=Effusibacillus lacus TaxID=1348429 RepID=A0A292YPM3_9BACL|nr:hypothetical protein EFBL_3589 [Effusibacillus lacus]
MLAKAGLTRPNFKGQQIPVGAGAVMYLVFALVGLLLIILDKLMQQAPLLGPVLTLASGMAFLGLVDDVAGNRETSGLRGHLRKWIREGELTTGFVKALCGAGFALGVAVWGSPYTGMSFSWFGNVIADAMVIALMANWINLLDVRPGRALKGSLLTVAGLIYFASYEALVPLSLLTGVALGYYPADIRAKAMMGDVGSNFLGAVIGYAAVATFNFKATLMVLASLLALHWYTEHRSLSDLIANNKWLDWMDRFGRGEAR